MVGGTEEVDIASWGGATEDPVMAVFDVVVVAVAGAGVVAAATVVSELGTWCGVEALFDPPNTLLKKPGRWPPLLLLFVVAWTAAAVDGGSAW